MSAPSEHDLSKIEETAFTLLEALAQIGAFVSLDRVQRHAVIELLHYTCSGAAGREFDSGEKAQLDELKRLLFERAEKNYAENKAAQVTGVNTTGGQA